MMILNELEKFVNEFDSFTAKPENFLSIQDDLQEPVKKLTKALYDFTKNEEKKLSSTNALPELIIDQFDTEQIWQELELQNEDRWTHILSDVSTFISSKNDFVIPVDFSGMENVDSEDELENEENGDDLEEDEEAEDEAEDEEEEIQKPKKTKQKKKNEKGSIVDDRFFKLRDMEAFLDAEDKKEMMKDRKKQKSKTINDDDDDDEDDDDDIDLFDEVDSEDEDDVHEDGKYMKYSDFFDEKSSDSETEKTKIKSKRKKKEKEESQERASKKQKIHNEDEDEDENIEDEEEDIEDEEDEVDDEVENDTNKLRKVRFDLPQPSSDDDDDDDDDGNEDDENNKEAATKTEELSEYQLRQQRLNKKISHLENNLLQEKSWTMKGEIDATNRPQNSLLEEIVDFDMISRPAPVITEETTIKLQDIIIQRIKDKAWDDVERKAKPVQEVNEFKKQLVLDQEKSKLSLSQIYEQEYIKQREALDPDADDKPEEEPKEHIEIRQLMTSLFSKLDALGDFHYTPKVAVPEVKIISNMPAITMEEVAPVATSDATLLAPEEVKAKPKGNIIGKSERTDTDKKRERRLKKLKQREREKEKVKREKLIEKMRPGLGNKYSKEKMDRLLKDVTKDRNVTKMEEMNEKKSLTSSSKFFSQLQDEVTNMVKTKQKSSQKKEKKLVSAKKLKL